MDRIAIYAKKYKKLLPNLPERARRLVVGSDAKMLGRGGIAIVHKASGLARKTIWKGMKEVAEKASLPADRNRKDGGGRKKITEKDKTLETDLLALVEDSSRGDPESPLKWTNKSLRTLSKELVKKDHAVSHTQTGHILKANDYRLQGNKKNKEGTDHPDRDAQFKHINKHAKERLDTGDPVISVDTKKKELVGNYKNNGQRWLPKGKPVEVGTHDFPDPNLGKAVPYGMFDIGKNEGYVNVGINHDTGEFAVASIRRWWENLGKERYPQSKRLLITADAGGSNGYRLRLWKKELQTFADESGLEITVCHFPPGTSKWNKIEHKLFSFISINWKGRPLMSYETIVNLIANTKTASGLKVYATLDERTYQLKRKITDKEMKALQIEPDAFHGEWNYAIKPRK
ncbi:MAG: ISAzo13 family transposase [Candidatus Yonathbacteria bacterium]|nr:ISAzo13 family transposase [Candidatus Yonathbacteria bacterium]